MTVGTTQSSVTVEGNGVTTVFTYNFPIPAASDAVVVYTDATGNQTTLQSSQYVITGLGSATGGTVTYPTSGSPIVAGTYLTIERVLALIQTTSISSQGPTFAAIEQALDYQMECVQQVGGSIGNAFRAPPTDPSGLNYTAPVASQRASQVLGWDGAGNVIAAQPTGTLISAAMQPVVQAATVGAGFNALAASGGTVGGTLAANALTVGGASTFVGAAGFSALATFGNGLTVATGMTTLEAGLLVTAGGAAITGNSTVVGQFTATTGLGVSGGGASIVGASTVSGSLGVTGGLTADGGLTTDATTSNLGGNVVVAGYIAVNGSTPLTGTGYTMNATTAPVSQAWNVGVAISLGANLYFAGYGIVTASDRRVKADIRDISPESGADWVRRGRPRLFTVGGKLKSGFIAQEDIDAGRGEAVMSVPDEDPRVAAGDGFAAPGFRLTRDYEHDIAYLTAALQHVLARLEVLEKRA